MNSSWQVRIIPCFQDNYSYCLVQGKERKAILIDPCEFSPIEQFIKNGDLELSAILITHFHHDHIAGLELLLQEYPKLQLFGRFSQSFSSKHKFTRTFSKIQENFELHSLNFLAIRTLGHSLNCTSYLVNDCLFSGDVLSSVGCGRLLEGTAEQLHQSLEMLKKVLAPSTKIYFGHEYTRQNIDFALSLDPYNLNLQEKKQQLLITPRSTPSTWKAELLMNPFLRCSDRELRKNISTIPNAFMTDLAVFIKIRQMKDQF